MKHTKYYPTSLLRSYHWGTVELLVGFTIGLLAAKYLLGGGVL